MTARNFGAAFCAFTLIAFSAAGGIPAEEVQRVGMALENLHYSEDRKLDDGRSNAIFEIFTDDLDPERVYFYREDIERLRGEWAGALDDQIKSGDLSGAEQIYSVFAKRFGERAERVKVIAEKVDIGDGKVSERRGKDDPWVSGVDNMDSEWAKKLDREMTRLAKRRAEKDGGGAVERADGGGDAVGEIAKRYANARREVDKKNSDEVRELFLSAACRSYDPHSDYLGPKNMEEFDISMGLQLCGIGAVLSGVDGVATVESLVPGGPAAKSGELLKGDRILGVGQSGDEMEDVAGYSLEKIVGMIRGEKGSIVRLDISRGEGEGQTSKTVSIRRDDVQLNDQAVKGAIFRRDGKKLGLVTIPSFYSDDSGRSVAKDAAGVIAKLGEAGAEGLVLDLRQDGGGVLNEAVRLAGIFIPGKAVVQILSSNGGVVVKQAPYMKTRWDKPLVVLVDRYSASASEIFCGAIQDHGAGIIVGDKRTFGKGTVQVVLDLEKTPLLKLFSGQQEEKTGAVKITVQKFYRASGGSTQEKGVESDIVIPSPTDTDKIGEVTLRGHLPYDTTKAIIPGGGGVGADTKGFLRAKSADRVAKDPQLAKRVEFLKSSGSKSAEAPEPRRGEHNDGLLGERGMIVNSLRGGGVETETGEVGRIYTGNPMPAMAGEKGDPSLEESVSIVWDYVGTEGGKKIASKL